jgi:hypothetical protein
MLHKALLLVLITLMATMPSLASACALDCASQAAGTMQHSGGHCQGAGGSDGAPADGSTDSAMASLCIFAATGAISVEPPTVSASAPAYLIVYSAAPTFSEITAPPDEPPRG